MTAIETFAVAMAHHQAGRLAEAEALYRQLLAADAEDVRCLHLLGVIAHQVGRHDLAISLIGRAISLDDRTPEFHNNIGGAYRALGRSDEARGHYERALALAPDYVDALNNLGTVFQQQDDLDSAVTCFGRALVLAPNYAEIHANLGTALQAQGDLEAAVRSTEQALALKPDYSQAHYNLGNIRRSQGRSDAAVAAYERALALDPGLIAAHVNLGVLLKDQGRFEPAAACFERALAVRPNAAEAHDGLGSVRKAQGRLEAAVDCFIQALTLKPDFVEARNNLGIALHAQGKLDGAVSCFERALELAPELAELHNNLGSVLQDQGKRDLAQACHERALALRPDYPEALINLGSVLHDLGRLEQAVARYERALALLPDYADAHYNLGNALKGLGRLEEALACYRRALDLKPDMAEAHDNLMVVLHYAPSASNAVFLDHALRWAARFEPPEASVVNQPDPERRLRVGYVSADFRNHPVGYFLGRVMAAHDRSRIEAYCYSNAFIADETTSRLRQSAAGWREVAGLSDDAAAALIRVDSIDLLVDLSGYTARNRLGLFARRLAPVQVSWLGYFGTTGLAAMDHILADRFVIPVGEEPYYSETVVRLPDGYLCFDPPALDVAEGVAPVTETGVLTFGCFNNRAKITDAAIRLWAGVLAEMPRARLLLKTSQFNDPGTRSGLWDAFKALGVEPSRVLIEGGAPRPEFMAAYRRMDIALDPCPFGGGTTTAEALWMGVPVITLRGERWVGRVSESILNAVGLPELVAGSAEEYRAVAKRLAFDVPRLAELRAGLRRRLEASPLCDGHAFTRNLEAAYRAMWRDCCNRGALG